MNTGTGAELISPGNTNRTTAIIHVDQTPISCTLAELGTVRVEMVRYTEHEPLYNSLVDQFHYLGYAQIVGNHLKYMAFAFYAAGVLVFP